MRPSRHAGPFGQRLAGLGIARDVPAGPKTGGKLAGLFREVHSKMGHFENVMVRTSGPVDLFMRWYNFEIPHMSPDAGTPARAFEEWMSHPGIL